MFLNEKISGERSESAKLSLVEFRFRICFLFVLDYVTSFQILTGENLDIASGCFYLAIDNHRYQPNCAHVVLDMHSR